MKIKVFIPGLCGDVCPKVLTDYMLRARQNKRKV